MFVSKYFAGLIIVLLTITDHIVQGWQRQWRCMTCHVTSRGTSHMTDPIEDWRETSAGILTSLQKQRLGRRCSGYIRVFWRKSLLRGLQSLQLPSLDSWQRMQIDSKLVIPLVIILIRPGLSNSKHWVLTALWDPSLASPSSLHSSLGKFGSNSKDSSVFPIRKLGGIYVFRCLLFQFTPRKPLKLL